MYFVALDQNLRVERLKSVFRAILAIIREHYLGEEGTL